MAWKIVRLELASNGEFPRGSVGRSYLIRLPLTKGGMIDDAQLGREPDRATVRRFWASEPDATGYFSRDLSGYAIRGDGDGSAQTRLVQFNDDEIRLGDQVMMKEPDGTQMSFRVASVG